ncbi:hypothetical protein MJL27_26530, partial [Salmonella enterica subsp. enterica serovar Anatum]|nr:hypothetical protein [Salmonella enterica subsp. enterica serovar Anatum]
NYLQHQKASNDSLHNLYNLQRDLLTVAATVLGKQDPVLTSMAMITLVGYSAMGGAVGAGGLGQIGYQYGYIGYNATVMNTVLVLL